MLNRRSFVKRCLGAAAVAVAGFYVPSRIWDVAPTYGVDLSGYPTWKNYTKTCDVDFVQAMRRAHAKIEFKPPGSPDPILIQCTEAGLEQIEVLWS